MLKPKDFVEVRLLYRIGRSIREIGRITGHARSSVRRVLRIGNSEPVEAAPQAGSGGDRGPVAAPPARTGRRRPGRRSQLEGYEILLRRKITEATTSRAQMLAELRQEGYSGSRKTLQRFLRANRVELADDRERVREWMRRVLQGAINPRNTPGFGRNNLDRGHFRPRGVCAEPAAKIQKPGSWPFWRGSKGRRFGRSRRFCAWREPP